MYHAEVAPAVKSAPFERNQSRPLGRHRRRANRPASVGRSCFFFFFYFSSLVQLSCLFSMSPPDRFTERETSDRKSSTAFVLLTFIGGFIADYTE